MSRTRILSLIAAALFLLPLPALAQEVVVNMGEGGSFSGRVVQLLMMITVLSLAPSILIVMTSFTRIIIVLSLLRSAIGTQQTPPNVVLISLALFLTGFIMQPTLEVAWKTGIAPLMAEQIDESKAIDNVSVPFHAFMSKQVREKDLKLFFELSNTKPPQKITETPMTVLIPAFMISELRRAFEIGFLLFVPFLIIDLVVASILMAMGMMMLPPVMISLPFKLIFFVLVDGWALVAGSLVKSFRV
ncbi:flagellar type III secretion system pore protein FliP [Govanella unica]|uniref:Flagellar biosynthetic protein FliP n=1 Tax=Govanella unica TaxID=2975056 RepID=A0A9X3TWV1_9PROT|nr:flagellar type III secretion system pore protein FliP [Govania unica]MDA5193228.1 flagellar type III secretion system pore protein FliP [Govania unica]